jgi:hypothetical protein
MAGLIPFSPGPATYYPWDRESDKVAAVITLNGVGSESAQPDAMSIEKRDSPKIEAPMSANLSADSPLSRIPPGAPPFLLVEVASNDSVSALQSSRFLGSMHSAGNRADLVTIPAAFHKTKIWNIKSTDSDWERQMIQWLHQILYTATPESANAAK